ncbi:MAG: D-glycero-beta-D-manno-heptose-7-phosphate kinase [Fluviicola sp.]|nr:MAG: D-glycero-beta-D-manno-heptose-7-phosphate kinase [Fluviicola sp.]
MDIDVNALFNQFSQQRILVVGDVMIDAYLRGSVTRISPEAPVSIVNLKQTEDRLGGAANVALNLASLGAEPILCAIVGDDKGGRTFRSLLDERGLSNDGIVKCADRMTTIKTRVIGNNQHLLRIDEEVLTNITAQEENEFIQRIERLLTSKVDAIILEDYNKGLLTPRVIESIVKMANERKIPVTVDPKKDNFFAYKNVTLFKPNLKELKEGVGATSMEVTNGSEFEAAVLALEAKLNNQITLVTLSEHGVFIKREGDKKYIPAHVRNIADVSGAGDTVIAVATLCLVAGLAIEHIADIANLSGGLVCEVSGVVPINAAMLKEEIVNLQGS